MRGARVARSRLAALALVSALALSCCRAGTPAAAEARAAPPHPAAFLKPGRAVLARGTEPARGLPFFGPNAIEGLYGRYELALEPNGARYAVELWYTRAPLVLPSAWTRADCAAAPRGSLSSSGEGSVSWYLPGEGYALLVRFPSEYPDPCRFAAVLAERFAFFRRYAPDEAAVSFPAILELGA